ncbi:MAG: Xaa-Pro peptidase family protein, partial [Gemmatimonadota bacterium]|nr:Xaa-Pro peptidase family protein [Gemmatimonadota bacterium]
MPSRREFLGTGALVALGATASRPLAAEPLASRQQALALPPAIAALSSQKERMVPITNDERRARIEQARRLMGNQGLDAIVLTGGTSLRYFTNMSWGLSERLLAVILPREGAPFIVCPAFERDRAEEQISEGPLAGSGAEVMTWHEHESPYALVAQGLRARQTATGAVGIEETVRWVFSDGIASALPSATLRSATPVTAGCRSIKSPAELALMRLASEVTWKAYKAAYESLQDGMTQDDFGRLVSQAHQRQGFQGGASVQVGQYSALPHGSVTPQVIREGTILLIDGGCTVGGYQSDLSRTFVLGKATDRMNQVFEIEHRAQTAALQAARPGVPCEAVDAAARRVITEAGFGPDYAYFTHRVGHGIGMDGHEWPYLVRGNTLPL